MNAASNQVCDYIAYSEKHVLKTAKLFLGTLIVCPLFITGTLWWSHHVISELAQDKADLVTLDTKLKHTPVSMHFEGKDYVRVVPDSETSFTRGDGSEVSGRYAKVWHLR